MTETGGAGSDLLLLVAVTSISSSPESMKLFVKQGVVWTNTSDGTVPAGLVDYSIFPTAFAKDDEALIRRDSQG